MDRNIHIVGPLTCSKRIEMNVVVYEGNREGRERDGRDEKGEKRLPLIRRKGGKGLIGEEEKTM